MSQKLPTDTTDDCPECGKEVEFDITEIDSEFTCPHCNKIIEVTASVSYDLEVKRGQNN